MTNVFTFIGTRRDDPDQLLLQGDDGAYYTCPSLEFSPTPVDLDNQWELIAPAEEEAGSSSGEP